MQSVIKRSSQAQMLQSSEQSCTNHWYPNSWISSLATMVLGKGQTASLHPPILLGTRDSY